MSIEILDEFINDFSKLNIKKNKTIKTDNKTNHIKTDNIKTNNIKTNNIKTNNIKTDNIKTNNIKTNNIKTDNIKTNNIKTNNIKKLTKNQEEIDILFKPNKDGFSEWIKKEDIDKNDKLRWGNNGVFRHGLFRGDNRYIWHKYPLRGKIEKIRVYGYTNNYLNGHNRPIRDDIHKYHKSIGCVVCGSRSDLVTDHKNDLYNDPRVLNIKTQTKEDFQCLCNHCNLQKREISKKTLETGKRYGATNIYSLAIYEIDFITGNESFDKNDINAMVGTYWYDPVKFMSYIKMSLVSQ